MTDNRAAGDNRQELRFAIVGPGRLGRALAAALTKAGASVQGPLGRGAMVEAGVDVVLLCVPEREIASAAAALAAGAAVVNGVASASVVNGAAGAGAVNGSAGQKQPLVGHCSASAPLSLLAPHERFAAHPLMTVTAAGASFKGAACAVDGSSARALDVAVGLAARLGMMPVRVPAERRALYHAAASLAANFLVTLESAAERLASECGVERAHLAPLVRATVANWEAHGFGAITGPLARSDDATVAAQRAAIAESADDLLPLWDALAERTRAMLRRAP